MSLIELEIDYSKCVDKNSIFFFEAYERESSHFEVTKNLIERAQSSSIFSVETNFVLIFHVEKPKKKFFCFQVVS